MKHLLRFIPLLLAVSAEASIVDNKSPLPNFADLLANADTLGAYEGLPHPVFEQNAREDERLSKTIFLVSGELFYERIIDVSDEDRKSLDRLFRTTPICALSG